MCFDSGDDGSSREMINMQKEEAKRAAAKEADRQNRITQGLSYIKNMFEGAPEMRAVNRKFDWGKFKAPTNSKLSGTAVSGLPAGFTYKKIPGTAGNAGTAGTRTLVGGPTGSATPGQSVRPPGGWRDAGSEVQAMSGGNGSPNGGGNTANSRAVYAPGTQILSSGGSGSPNGGGNTPNSQPVYQTVGGTAGTSGTPDRWVIQGPDGKTYEVGSDVIYGEQEATGNKIGDWQQKFKDNYRQSMLDYYEPQVAEQFTDANNETIYGHARAGTLDSTAKLGNLADLIEQNTKNVGDVRAKADSAVNDLGEKILRERTAAEAQLYSTENPEVAATAAQRSIENITAEAPPTTPLADLFTIAATGGANIYKGYTNASRINTGFGGGGNSGRNQKVLGA